MPKQLRKFVIDNAQILGNGTVSVKNYFKTKLDYPNLTLMPPIPGGSPQFFLTRVPPSAPPILTPTRVMGSFLNGISAIA